MVNLEICKHFNIWKIVHRDKKEWKKPQNGLKHPPPSRSPIWYEPTRNGILSLSRMFFYNKWLSSITEWVWPYSMSVFDLTLSWYFLNEIPILLALYTGCPPSPTDIFQMNAVDDLFSTRVMAALNHPVNMTLLNKYLCNNFNLVFMPSYTAADCHFLIQGTPSSTNVFSIYVIFSRSTVPLRVMYFSARFLCISLHYPLISVFNSKSMD